MSVRAPSGGTQAALRARRFPLGWRFALACFLFHLTMAVTIRGAEAPDEWWQSAEVAYYLVFRKGSPTWEWRQGIRSVFFPSLFAIGFKLLQMLKLDTPRALYLSERVTQALILTGVHVTMCYLAQRLEQKLEDEVGPPEPAATKTPRRHSLLRSLTGFFFSTSLVVTVARAGCIQWYFVFAGVRAYSNVTEALFFLLALVPTSLPWFLLWAGLACATRVTAAISLIPVFVDHYLRLIRSRGLVKGTLHAVVSTTLLVCAISAGIVTVDYLFYQRILFTPYEFIKSNIGDNVSSLFGEHPVHWYFVLALPLMVNIHYVLSFAASVVAKRIGAGPRTQHDIRLYLSCLVWTLAVHSFVPHKEMRFVYSQVPISLLLGSFVTACAARYPSKVFGKARTEDMGASRGQHAARVLRWAQLGSLVLNVVLLIVAGFFVREGCLDIMAAVRNGPYHYNTLDSVTHCYLLPGYSQVHGKVNALGFVDCPVVLDAAGQLRPTEDQLVRRDDVRFVWWKYARKELPPTDTDNATAVAQWYATARSLPAVSSAPADLPDGIILFQELAEKVQHDFLEPRGYVLVKRVHHLTFVEDEGFHIDLWRRGAES